MSTKSALIEECKRLGYTGYASLNKPELVKFIEDGGEVKSIEGSEVITLTFGEQAENNIGMEILGNGLADDGFTIEDLEEIQQKFDNAELTRLDFYEGYPAAILIIRGGVNHFVSADDLFIEQKSLTWDKKAFMRGQVKNKHARWNLCYAEEGQEPNYAEKMGRIVAFDDVPLTRELRNNLHTMLGEKADNLQVEGNYYYNLDKCKISFHGDAERKRVVAVRLGSSMPLRYQWFLRSEPVGDHFTFQINHGDMYIMSEKATGFDWKKKIIPTLRHAAGLEKHLVYKKK